ncbi:MAG: glycosyltransferase [Caulobacteraceae bacterium]
MTPHAPRITIAIPTVNRLDLLKRALASATGQTVAADIIVSDNGSTDGTDAYLSRLPEESAYFRRFRHPSTIPVQRHAAFLAAQIRTDWVVILSDDDFLESGFVAGVMAVIDEHPTVAMVYTGCDIYYSDISVPARVGPPIESTASFLVGFMKGNRNICMCSTLFRSSDIIAYSPQPDNVLIGDMYYWTKVLSGGKIVGCCPTALSNYTMYRPSGSSETSRMAVTAWADESKVLARAMTEIVLSQAAADYSRATVTAIAKKYLALTVSNQFVWTALRGASRLTLLRSLVQSAGTLTGSFLAGPRAMAAVILPRPLLKWGVLFYARAMARSGGKN